MENQIRNAQNEINSIATILLKAPAIRTTTEAGLVSNIENSVTNILNNYQDLSDSQKQRVRELVLPSGFSPAIVQRLNSIKATDDQSAQRKDKENAYTKQKPENRISQLLGGNLAIPKVTLFAQPANELNAEQVNYVYECLTEYFKTEIFQKSSEESLTDEEFAACMASYFASMKEQSTSVENVNNNNLVNNFTLNDKVYTWDRAKVVKFLIAKFGIKKDRVQNIERRFGRSESNNIDALLQKLGYENSERLGTQWGVLDSTRGHINDFNALYKSTNTPRTLSAQVAATEYATTKGNKDQNPIHVTQVLGPRSQRRN
ncbi:coat protein [Cordyline virus 3]|uniref:Coat protein n=1 Tax=Cordyline virus 3 TaxID=1177752 RepID=M1N1V1_9CLOS|nr:coat protein [Cordyline virus 3]AGF73884.1 coat protein [Cordyline virus 3]